ncbi:hypothetical protein [Phytohabitans rumicis]|uniref:Uncharacterized protein n=1 Tax=Phytohabitans rumicis TaxID=1076125 RepID=A0A6V8LFW4_9ACTN|nr:hypothetical protein [Phytohabitans rumicis]GFJ95204.1 hypothetical protein Prum_088460 [Phytohabitans rumicis]
MPIDLAPLAAAFATQLRGAVLAQRGITPALERRRTAGRTVELATRRFPIVRFYNGAVTLWLEPGQREVLTLAVPPPSFTEHLARGGLGFLTGIRLAGAPFGPDSQETAIPRLLAAAIRVLDEIEASVRRFATPGPAMFDPDARTASDLIGLAALGFRALAEASRQGGEVQRLVREIRRTLDTLGIPAPAAGAAGDVVPAGTEQPARPLADQLDAAAFALLGATTVVGTLPALLGVLLEGVALRVRILLLDEFAAIERHVLELRATLFELAFTTLVGLADRGVRLVLGGHEVVAANVLFAQRLARAFLTDLWTGLRGFVGKLTDYLVGVLKFIVLLDPVLNAIMRFDLRELLGWWAQIFPPVALGDLLDRDGEGINTSLRDFLLELVDAAEDLADDVIPPYFGYPFAKIAQLRRLVHALFDTGGPTAKLPAFPEGVALRFRSDFPDLSQTPFGGGRFQQMRDEAGRIGTAVRTGLGRALDATATGLDGLAVEFARGAARAADLRAGGQLARIGPQAAQLAEGFQGSEVARERAALAARQADPLAAGFETWLADGGFVVIGEVLAGYVAGLAAHWREQAAEGTELTVPVTPTSPHILLRRAAVGRVLVPRLTLRAAPGRELDESLADAVAAHFAAAVREAYTSGRRKLRELADAGGR